MRWRCPVWHRPYSISEQYFWAALRTDGTQPSPALYRWWPFCCPHTRIHTTATKPMWGLVSALTSQKDIVLACKGWGCVEWLWLSRDCGCADGISTWARWCCRCKKWPDGWQCMTGAGGRRVCDSVLFVMSRGCVCRRTCKMALYVALIVVLYCVKHQ